MNLMHLYVIAIVCLLGMLWNYKEREWTMFGVFLAIEFFTGMAIYFRLILS